jgi:hypothetical protein
MMVYDKRDNPLQKQLVYFFLHYGIGLCINKSALYFTNKCSPINIYLFFAVLGIELKAFNLSHYVSTFFVMGIFQIGSPKLFAWTVFEPQSS